VFDLTFYSAMPDPITVDYLEAVLNICNGRNRNSHEDDEQVQELTNTLGLSKDELEQSVDQKSIRKTCRNVLRKVFKAELANPEIPYSQVLLNEEIMSAIRRKYTGYQDVYVTLFEFP
jgi:hypothetical protein